MSDLRNNLSDIPLSRTPVWDLPTRLFHWTLLIACVVAWLTATRFNTTAAMRWHLLAGYVALALLLFRIFWGIWGSHNSRFVFLWQESTKIPEYLPTLLQRHSHYRIGHNPLGSLSVMLLLLALAAVTTSGLFTSDAVSVMGPWAHLVSDTVVETISAWHAESFNVLAVLVGLHIAAILFYRWFKYDNLLLPMISGDKALPVDTPPLTMVSNVRALVFLLIASGLTLLIALTPGQ